MKDPLMCVCVCAKTKMIAHYINQGNKIVSSFMRINHITRACVVWYMRDVSLVCKDKRCNVCVGHGLVRTFSFQYLFLRNFSFLDQSKYNDCISVLI